LRFSSFRTEKERFLARQACSTVISLQLIGSQVYFLLEYARLQTHHAGVTSR
jgi:hypothetical protein